MRQQFSVPASFSSGGKSLKDSASSSPRQTASAKILFDSRTTTTSFLITMCSHCTYSLPLKTVLHCVLLAVTWIFELRECSVAVVELN